MSSIDEVKARIDIVDLVSETVQLRRSGKSYTGFCPFHPNSRTPAFVVFPESGTWRCFGQCNEGGDIFKFIMKREGWDFSEALRYLAEKAGVQLRPVTPQDLAAAEENEHLRALLEEAGTYFRHQLLNTQGGQFALDYLQRKRGLSAETIETFGLGYAPASWDALANHLLAKGHTRQDLLDAGLVSEREGSGGIYDRFRHRITFPIRDERGRMAGFGARILDPDDIPKFLNSPQTAVFDKGRLLYGLDRARKAIRDQDRVVIVEGYLDVIALHQAGFTNTVSPMGTALTEPQLYLLKRLSRRIVLALDPDAAGDKATLRGLQIARQAMDHEQDPVFDARGLLGYESRLQADIRVTTLPPGSDPDEVVNGDPKTWEQIIENARPIVVHVMEVLAAGRDLDDARVKSEIVDQVLPLIDDLASPVERDTYRQRLARLVRVDERTLLQMPRQGHKPRPFQRRPQSASTAPSRASQAQASPQLSTYGLETHCLGVLIREPELLYRVDRLLLEAGLNRLAAEDFQHADHQAIFRVLLDSIDQDITEPLNFVMNTFSLPMMELADGMLERTQKLDPQKDRVLEDLVRGLLELRLRTLHQDIEYQRYLMEQAQLQGDMKASEHVHTMLQYAQAKKRIDQALARYTSRSSNA